MKLEIKMPPIEFSEIIKECKQKIIMNLAQAQALRYGAQKVKVYPDWIPCSERLPSQTEDEVMFISTRDMGSPRIYIGYYYDFQYGKHFEQQDTDDRPNKFFLKDVTHWMPLPPVPNK